MQANPPATQTMPYYERMGGKMPVLVVAMSSLATAIPGSALMATQACSYVGLPAATTKLAMLAARLIVCMYAGAAISHSTNAVDAGRTLSFLPVIASLVAFKVARRLLLQVVAQFIKKSFSAMFVSIFRSYFSRLALQTCLLSIVRLCLFKIG